MGINLAGVDLILQLNAKIEKLQNDVENYKNKIKDLNRFGVVPSSKALVIKKSSYDIVIIKE
jgi:MerR family transcriptional regulator/heat shock protein HspR